MTTTLATRELTLAELGRRIDLNVKSGWGLETGTSAQLNLLALYCQKFHLLPGDDVTLYQGKPWITIDGRVKLMRRHKDEYRGHATRPLSKDEKNEWGYDPEDIVIEATIRTVSYGEIKARGRVSRSERAGESKRGNPVAVQNPVEMAEKRALSRVERYTFGTDAFIDDDDLDDAVTTVVEQRTEPARVKANAAAYDRIHGIETPPEQLVRVGEPLAEQLAALVMDAAAGEVDYDDCQLPLPAPRLQVEHAIRTLQERITDSLERAPGVGES